MRLTQVALRAADLDRAVAFYTRLLGTAPIARFDPPGLAFFPLEGTRLLLDAAGAQTEGDAERRTSSQGATTLVYLGVPDVRELVGELRADGVEIVSEPHVIFTHENDALGPSGTDEWHAFITDSEGNLVGLISLLPRGPRAGAPARA